MKGALSKILFFLGLTLGLIILSRYNFSFNKSSFSAALPDQAELKVQKREQIHSDEDLAKMIGQMLLVGFNGSEINATSDIAIAVKELNLGGVILFDKNSFDGSLRNIKSKEQLKKLISDLQEKASTPLFISIDVEGGLVNRLKKNYGFIDLLSQEEIRKNGADFAKISYDKKAQEMRDLGINMNFAPVLDLFYDKNPLIGGLGRSFSQNENEVIKFATIAIDSFENNNIVSVAKHFPGQGSALLDNHQEIVDITDVYQENEMMPYQELIKEKKLSAVMVSHLINKNVDADFPASLSAKHINNKLRTDLGFDGICITDDLQMGVIKKYGLKESLVASINAGCDMMLLSNNLGKYDERSAFKAFDAIFEAVSEGSIPIERIKESSERIGQLKAKYLK